MTCHASPGQRHAGVLNQPTTTMITNTQSQYELHQAESRAQQQGSAETAGLVSRHRADVEEVIRREGRATRMEAQISAYDADENFREQVAADRSQWRCRVMLLAAVFVYIIGEFFASGDVAATLAVQIAPLFNLGAIEEPPVWLRRLAGCGFVVIMLFATLGIKYAASVLGAAFETAKARATVGQSWVFWSNSIGVWVTHLAKVAYLVAVSFLYLWLYGFAQDRAALHATDKAEEAPAAPIKYERGAVVEPQPPVADGDKAERSGGESKKSDPGSRLGMATGVLYICLWLIHGVVIVLPVNGRELEFAHFKRGASEQRVHAMRENQGRLLRDILERIHSVEGENRDVLIRETQPIAHLVNKAAGRSTMDVPRNGPDEEPPAAASVQNPTPPPTPAPTAAAAVAEPQDDYEVIFGKHAAA